MRSVALFVDELRVEGAWDRPAEVGPVLEEALRILADRLGRHAADLPAIENLYLEALRLEVCSPDEILGPRGADLIATRLYDHLTEMIG